MRIIHKCSIEQGRGSASPKGYARALVPSQSYRFVNNSYDQPSYGRRPQIFSKSFSNPYRMEKAKTLQVSDGRPEGAVGEIILRLEPAKAEFIVEQRSLTASWLHLKQLIEPLRVYRGELTFTR